MALFSFFLAAIDLPAQEMGGSGMIPLNDLLHKEPAALEQLFTLKDVVVKSKENEIEGSTGKSIPLREVLSTQQPLLVEQ